MALVVTIEECCQSLLIGVGIVALESTLGRTVQECAEVIVIVLVFSM